MKMENKLLRWIHNIIRFLGGCIVGLLMIGTLLFCMPAMFFIVGLGSGAGVWIPIVASIMWWIVVYTIFTGDEHWD